MAPITASMASARIEGFSRPPDESSPLPSSKAAPTRSSPCRAGERDRIDHRGPRLGQLSLGKVGVGTVQVVGDDQPEDGVAQELEALVGLLAGVLGAPRTVGQCLREQLLVATSQPKRSARPARSVVGLVRGDLWL